MSDGPILTALDAFAAQLRDAHHFRRWADPDAPWDQATAEAHVFVDALPPPAAAAEHTADELADLRPFALLWQSESAGLQLTADSAAGAPAIGGTIIVRFEQLVPAHLVDDPKQLTREIARWLGGVLRTGSHDEPGIWELGLRPGYVPLRRTIVSGPWRPEATEATSLGDFIAYELEVQWGRS